MTTHRFSVNVPNPGSKAVAVQLRLEAAAPEHLSRFHHKGEKNELKVVHAGIALDPSAKEGKRTLTLKLKPQTNAVVQVIIHTSPPRNKKPALVAFHLVDRRNEKVAGGVTLICTHPPHVDPKGKDIPASNPCPAVLAKEVYAIKPGSDPSKATSKTSIVAGQTSVLVAQIKNSTSQPLTGAKVYLEHLGLCVGTFNPGTWNIGNLDKGIFYATWNIQPSSSQKGEFKATIVVMSQGFDPVRIRAAFKVS